MTKEQAIEILIGWCLQDEKWREAFQLERFDGPYEFIKLSKNYFQSESLIEIRCREAGCISDYDIPLTQFLLSPETVRVCHLRKFGEYRIENRNYHLSKLGESSDRLQYYITNFIEPYLAKQLKQLQTDNNKKEGES